MNGGELLAVILSALFTILALGLAVAADLLRWLA